MELFEVGDRVITVDLPDHSPRERDAMCGKRGTVIELSDRYLMVRFDEDILTLPVKNDHLLTPVEVERI